MRTHAYKGKISVNALKKETIDYRSIDDKIDKHHRYYHPPAVGSLPEGYKLFKIAVVVGIICGICDILTRS